MRQAEYDVAIIGGGMVGLALACALRGRGLSIAVLERNEPGTFLSLGRDCRVSAIVEGNREALSGIGVWQELKDAQPIVAMRVWDDQQPGGIRFDAVEIGRAQLGWLVENRRLIEAELSRVMDSDDVDWLCPVEVASVEVGASWVRLALADGGTMRARLVVGADGPNSWLRRQRRIGVWRRDYRQKGLVATIRPERAHQGVAFQRFLPGGPLAVLPMTDGLCSIVWSLPEREAERMMRLSDEAFLHALQASFGPVLGRILEVGERAAFPLRAQLAHHLVRPRLALVGDAAHTIHPLAGLGVNLGLRDAMVLAQEIADAARFGEDIGGEEVLARYRHLRLPDVLAVMAGMEGFHRLFTAPVPGLGALRSAGMRAVSNLGPIKRLLMQNGAGLSLPVPRQIT